MKKSGRRRNAYEKDKDGLHVAAVTCQSLIATQVQCLLSAHLFLEYGKTELPPELICAYL